MFAKVHPWIPAFAGMTKGINDIDYGYVPQIATRMWRDDFYVILIVKSLKEISEAVF